MLRLTPIPVYLFPNRPLKIRRIRAPGKRYHDPPQKLDTRGDLSHRFQQKIHLTKLLYHHGWNKEQVLNLYKFIDWI